MRIFLAATNSGMNKELKRETIEKCKPKYVLETFFNGERICLEALKIVGNDNFLLDSGAFSYMNGAKVTLEQMEDYINRYIEFIKKYNIKYFFEVDVDNIFGLEQVEKWTRKIETSIGRQCIKVWHKGRGVEYWKQMCKEYKYVAVGGLVFHVKKQEYELIKKLVEYAHNRNVRVHGLGFTKTKELINYKFYSVDSASWTVAAARGQQIHNFNGYCIKTRALEKGNKKVNIGKLVSHNMCEWVKFQKYMDSVR
ncbi:hypothetical protein ACWYRQ_05530 [Clostridioides difficile]